MTKFARLRKEALAACRWRGHRMQRILLHYFFNGEYEASWKCRICGKQAAIKTRPMPNEIGIGGEAVALNCTGG